MKKYGLNELRELFLAFFEEKQHLRLPGFSLIPRNDASLLLINSGMAPMKTWFTGEQEPPSRRVCTCQKCIRTGDIDSVGHTSRHGTYFEMLGNFSFGDYFKRDAIVWCWEFLTERLQLSPELLYPSVYAEDAEAFGIWKDVVGIPPEKIIKLGKDDNFWDHGSGPCGPCSEVYFDRGASYGCGKDTCAPGCDCDRFVEVWNNVFTQFDNDGSGNYSELAQKNIDTGLGLERLACVCQGTLSIFEIDTIRRIVDKVSLISAKPYGKDDKDDISIRIITDHIRAATMMISDGILPSNEGRGYVLRRLLRRAARHGRLLGIKNIFLSDVCDVVIEENKNAYPDVFDKSDFIKRVIRTEEEAFEKTLDAGMAMLTGFIEKQKAKGETVLSGADTFKLYDTFGFPLELTVDILSEQGMTVNIEDFDKMMDDQRTRARTARDALGDLAWERLDLGLDSAPTEFAGYDKFETEAKILAIVSGGEVVSTLSEGESGYIILDKTPFYAEKGGQTADKGAITCEKAKFTVSDVQLNKADKYLHHGEMTGGTLSVGDAVSAYIDKTLRDATCRAHSATHLLQHALRTVLGEHINQAGSLVEPDKLRFDFTHFTAMTEDELEKVEAMVNESILNNYNIKVEEMAVSDAKKIGATALFGEKYGDIVRVVSMGESVELCGGTHIDCTARVGIFSITSEFSVASGVRRIEAVTGFEAEKLLRTSRKHLREISLLLKANTPDEIIGKIEQNIAAMREMRSKLESAESKQSGESAKDLLANATSLGGLKIIATALDDASITVDKARFMTDALRDAEPSVVVVFSINKNGKLTLMAACGKAAVEKGIKAGELIRELTKICGGSGGGKPDFAMGGGKNADKLSDALEFVSKYVTSKAAI